jgi:arylsulfatase A-like enzyme
MPEAPQDDDAPDLAAAAFAPDPPAEAPDAADPAAGEASPPRRRRTLPFLIVLGVAVVAVIAIVALVTTREAVDACDPPAVAATKTTRTDKRPNVVVIMTDDQTVTDMQFMPQTKTLLGAAGTTFANNFVSFPLCCPSRATALTGQYAHNHGVLNNVPPDGGFGKLDNSNTLPVWLQANGYNTAHVGKYLNSYGDTGIGEATATVPPGYTDWYGLIDPSVLQFYDYDVLDNGTHVHCGSKDTDYQTDVLSRRAAADIKTFAQSDKPFYLTVWPLAPHSATDSNKDAPNRAAVNPLSPLPRSTDVGHFAGLTYPHGPSFMEEDTSDKPPAQRDAKEKIAQGLAALHIDANKLNDFINQTYEARAESLLAVDDLVANVVHTLEDTGQLDNTIVMFTSDNGWLLGEHGIPFAKVVLYEEAVRVPFLVRGPGFPAGKTATQLVANIDVASTIASVTGTKPGLAVDGIDVTPLANDPEKDKNRAVLLEEYSFKPAYKAVRVPGYMYAEYSDGSTEFYDLFKDPYQLESKPDDPAYAKTRATLKKALDQLEDCKGTGCDVEVAQADLRG